MSMKFLVTGGAGFIGTNMCETLIKAGHSVLVIDNLSTGEQNVAYLAGLGVIVKQADIRNYDDIDQFFKDIDVVIHFAAMNRAQRSIENPREANDVNINGTLNCLELARKHNVKRFVNVSSSSVYAGQRNQLLSEDMPLSPPHPYGVGKLAGEHYARIYSELYQLETVSLRFFSVYGPRQLGSIDKAGVVAKFIHFSEQGLPLEIYGDGTQLRNFSYVTDVVECVMRSVEVSIAPGEVINVASPREVTVNYLAELVQRVTNKKIDIRYVPALAGDPMRNPANVEKCSKLLGLVPSTTFEDGIRHTYQWYLSTL